MLDALRKGANTWIAKILLGLLIASFGLWGIADIFTDRSTQSVASVGEETIGAQEFLTEYQRQFASLQSRFGPELTSDQALAMGLDQQVLGRLIARATYRAEAKEIGMTSSDDAVKNAILEMDVFKDPITQKFSRPTFDTALFNSGLTEGQFIDLLRDDITRQQLVNGLATGSLASDALSKNLYRVKAEKRSMRYFVVPAVKPEDVDLPAEETLKGFYEDRLVRYTAPEYRKVTFLTASPSDLVDTIELTEEEIQEEYEYRLDSLKSEAKATIDQIRLDDEETAQRVYDRLIAGDELAVVAKELADLEPEDLRLEDIRRGSLEDPYAEEIFNAADGAITKPVKTAFGWMVSKVVTSEDERVADLNEVRETIVNDLKLLKARDRLFEMSNEIEDDRAGGSTLEEVASKRSLSILTVDAIDARGMDKEGIPVTLLPDQGSLIANIFASDIAQDNDITETQNGGYYIFRVDEIIESRQKDFEEVKDQVEADWRSEEAERLTEANAMDLKNRLDAGETMTALATEMSTEPQTSTPITRDQTVAGAGPETVRILFGMVDGETAVGRTLAGDRVLFTLVDIVPANPLEDPTGFQEMRQQTTNTVAGEWIEQYERALQNDHGVSINRTRLNSLFSQGAS